MSISHKPTYEKREYANRDGASRTNKNNIQIFMHVRRTQCTLFLVSLHRFSNQNFDNQMPNILTSWLPKSLLLFNIEKKEPGAVLEGWLRNCGRVYMFKRMSSEIRISIYLLNQESQSPALGHLLPKVNGVPSSRPAIPCPPSPPPPSSFHFILFFILFFCFFISHIFLFRSTMSWGSMIKLLTPRFRYETACVTHHK